MSARDLLVVTHLEDWDVPLGTVDVISAKTYLAPEKSEGATRRIGRVFNLCRSYSYQSLGYYVSLLAEARGQRAIPSVATLRDFHSTAVIRSFANEIDETIQSSLRRIEENEFTLSIYFGQPQLPQFKRLSSQLYRLFPAPLLRIQFFRQKERWVISKVSPIACQNLTGDERMTIQSHAQSYFRRRATKPLRQKFLYDLAIWVDPAETSPPSDEGALRKFTRAAREMGFSVETLTPKEADRLTEFDALFIRQTTAVDHISYRISRLAHAEGLVVIDDPWSILRSANKIFLAESLNRAKLPTPRTQILTRDDLREGRLARILLPAVLKIPDGAFSRGVVRVQTSEELRDAAKLLLRESELILAQEFIPSEFDWRIGILDHQPLFACKYYMASGHWQIYNWAGVKGSEIAGKSQTFHVEAAPPHVVETACRAARLIGDGLYGVDLKQTGDRVVVIEVNDNPNIESGIEDASLGMELYRRIARSFRRRIEVARS